jgi:hypothetical protein
MAKFNSEFVSRLWIKRNRNFRDNRSFAVIVAAVRAALLVMRARLGCLTTLSTLSAIRNLIEHVQAESKECDERRNNLQRSPAQEVHRSRTMNTKRFIVNAPMILHATSSLQSSTLAAHNARG